MATGQEKKDEIEAAYMKAVGHSRKAVHDYGHGSADAEAVTAANNYANAQMIATLELIRGMNEIMERLDRLERAATGPLSRTLR